MSVIALERVRATYDGRDVLHELSLELAQGERVALLGPSGSGKTTLLRVILGFVSPAAGVVRIGGELASAADTILVPPERRGLGVVFQDLALWPHLDVAGNLGFGLAARGVPRVEREERVRATLTRVGLADRAHSYPGALSGGERQRVAIARALVLRPRAVLLDEPLSNLDSGLKRELLGFLAELLQEQSMAALYVTHDPREAARLANRIAVIESGRLAQVGSFEDLRRNPATPFVRMLFDDNASRKEGS